MNDISCRGSLRVRNVGELVIPPGDQRHSEEECSHGGLINNETNPARDLSVEGSGMKEVRVRLPRMKPGSFTPVSPVVSRSGGAGAIRESLETNLQVV